MTISLPRINLALVVFIAVLFALPFATVSCSSTTLLDATGYQLAIGTSPNNVLTAAGRQIVPSGATLDLSGRKPPMWSASLALLLVVLAGIVSFGASVRAAAWRAGICFGLAALSLFLLQSELQRAWQGHGYAIVPFVLTMQPAYWIVLVLSALGAGINLAAGLGKFSDTGQASTELKMKA